MLRKFSFLILLFFTTALLSAQNRGDLVSANSIRTFTIAQIQTELDSLGIPSGLVPLEYGVEVFSVIYKTPDVHGNTLVSASGIMAFPIGYPCDIALVNYNHGTKIYDVEAMANFPSEAFIVATLASNGYAVTGSDYLGLGTSPGIHPYIHANSEASASIDMLRAGRHLCSINQVNLNDQVFLTGYSQGGHAAMAVHREIEAHHSNEFQIAGAAPSGGVYHISEITTDFLLAPKPYPNPHYAAFILLAWQSVYGNLYTSLDDALVAPYDSLVPILLDRNNHTQSSLKDLLPDTIIRMIQPLFLQEMRTDSLHPYNVAARDNDVYDWVPNAPTRIYHCAGDMNNPWVDAIQTVAHMKSLGAPDIAFVDPFPLAGHSDCAPFAMLAAKAFFDSLRLDCNVGIKDLQAPSSKIEVFPHPVSGVSTVDFSGIKDQVGRIQLFDMSARVVRAFEGPFSEKKISIEKGTLAPGLYMLEIEGVYRRKIIIQ